MILRLFKIRLYQETLNEGGRRYSPIFKPEGESLLSDGVAQTLIFLQENGLTSEYPQSSDPNFDVRKNERNIQITRLSNRFILSEYKYLFVNLHCQLQESVCHKSQNPHAHPAFLS